MKHSRTQKIKPIQRVVLIDDDSTDNFLHARVLKRSGLVEHVVTFEHAEDALEFLSNTEHGVDVVCLDVNMPRMNGFEFLEAFGEIEVAGKKRRALVVILSTSISPEVERQALKYSAIVRTENKPLSLTTLESLVAEYFHSPPQPESCR